MRYIHDTVSFHHWENLDNRDLEAIWVTVRPESYPPSLAMSHT